MKKTILIVLIIFISFSVKSQIYKKHDNNKLKFYATLDFRNKFIENEPYASFGLKMGAGNKSIRFGASYHIFHKQLLNLFTKENYFEIPVYKGRSTSYHLFSLFTELIAHQTERWELLVPIHLGIGDLVQYNRLKKEEIIYRTPITSFVISTKANYRIFKWGGLTSGFGYNFAFSRNDQLQQDFSKPFYSFGIKLFFDEFGKMAKDKEYRNTYLFKFNFIND